MEDGESHETDLVTTLLFYPLSNRRPHAASRLAANVTRLGADPIARRAARGVLDGDPPRIPRGWAKRASLQTDPATSAF